MKINPHILNIPPFLSTTWDQVRSLRTSDNLLIIQLMNDDCISIPNLDQETIETIFACHSLSLEPMNPINLASHGAILPPNRADQETPFRLGFGATDGLGMAVQHNPAQANSPDLPKEILEKIGAIAKIVAPDDPQLLPTAEPNCNCMFCQFARVINPTVEIPEQPVAEEVISDRDLSFQQWEIVQQGEKLFTVINKLDIQESYNVFLGHPIGCTCGHEGCEHIVAVLKS